MFSISVVKYGLRMKSNDYFSLDIAREWGNVYYEKLQQASKSGEPFGQYADLRGFKPGPRLAQKILMTGMKAFSASGGQRSAVIVDTPLLALQMRRLSQAAGVYGAQRYLDPKTYPDFERMAIAWIVNGDDPDLA